MTALSEEQLPTESAQNSLAANNPQPQVDQARSKEQIIQAQKERTLFCINIDQNCTEDILYELFLQVGPIDNIIRKADRNGNIIALITYKHIESCDYAIKLFNGIKLFNQSLKVQQSQPGGQLTAKSSSTTLGSTQSTPLSQNRYSRKSIETQNSNDASQQMQSLIPGSQQNLMSLMSPLFQQFSPLLAQQFAQPSPNLNRSFSGPNYGENDIDYRTSRRNERHHDNRNHQQHHYRGSSHHQQHQNRRDFSNQDRDHRRSFNRSRSRSPMNKRRR